jgi:flavin-dependent dehydrogenase
MNPNRSRRDVVVVGGRVAGSATAMLLARLGHDVVVVAQASFPRGREKLREIVEQSCARSAVYDVITNGVPVAIEVDTP